MRNQLLPAIVVFATVTVTSLAFAQEEKDPDRIPQKGDTVIVVGCLRGSALESQETRLEKGTRTVHAAIAYRLTGDKEVLKQLKADHSRHLEEITGVLKSRLPDPGARGTQVGKTGLYVGIGAPTPNASQPAALPVLEVASFKHIGTECGR